MMSEETLFAAAIEIQDDSQRREFLDRECEGNSQLREQVEELLAYHGSSNPLDRAVPSMPTAAYLNTGTLAKSGTRIGPYKLMEQIGEGGFGLVFVAEQMGPVRRKVALKIIKPGMDSQQVIARFEAERQALAMMDHVNIAKVFDAGTTEEGRPYFVMELVHGTPITTFCDEMKLTPRERLELFVPVCQAIHHAHQKGIIHRDIKPSNILVTMYDDRPVPKVIDFGIAKAIEQRLTEKTIYTQYGTMVGTFEYVSPEQAEMNAFGVDTRSDVYSLGVLLYELITGTTPLDRSQLRVAAYGEIIRLIKEQEPVRPSIQLSRSETLGRVAATRKTEPAKLFSQVEGELDWIVMKCLEKDRTRRYDGAAVLARDIQNYLGGEAVSACPPTFGYRVSKAYRKNRAAILTTAAIGAALLFATVSSLAFGIQSQRSEEKAKEQQRIAAANADKAQRNAEAARKSEEQAQTSLNELKQSEYALKIQGAYAALREGNIGTWKALANSTSPDLRGWEWGFVTNHYQGPLLSLFGRVGKYNFVTFSPDGRTFAATNYQNSTALYDAVDGRQIKRWPSLRYERFVSYDSTGKWLLAKGPDAAAVIWNTETGEQVGRFQPEGSIVSRAVFSPDDTLVATCSFFGEPKQLQLELDSPAERRVHIWDAVTGKELRELAVVPGRVLSLEFSPDGTKLLTASQQRDGQSSTRVWDAESGKELFSVSGERAAFSPSGSLLVTVDTSANQKDETILFESMNQVSVWDATTGERIRSLSAQTQGPLESISFSPDGKSVMGSATAQIFVWKTETGVLKQRIDAASSEVQSEYSQDGSKIISASAGSIRIWDSSTNHMDQAFGGIRARRLNRQSFSSDGEHVLVRVKGNKAAMWHLAEGRAATVFDSKYIGQDDPNDGDEFVRAVLPDFWGALSLDGRRAATGTGWVFPLDLERRGGSTRVEVWDPSDGEKLFELEHGFIATAVAFTPDCSQIATACADGSLHFWDADSGTKLSSSKPHDVPIIAIAFHPDGSKFLTSCCDRETKIWKAPTNRSYCGNFRAIDTVMVRNSAPMVPLSLQPGIRQQSGTPSRVSATQSRGSQNQSGNGQDGIRPHLLVLMVRRCVFR